MGQFENTGASGGASVQYEMKRDKRTILRDMVISLIIIAVVLVFRIGFGGQTISVDLRPEEGEISVVGLDKAEHTLTFSRLESVELLSGLSDFDRGEQLSGETAKTATSGRFRNDAYGEYELHVMNGLDTYIVARGADGVLVFNYEADETTKGIYEYINENLPDE